MILVFIITFVMFIIITIILNSFINKNLLERQIIECIWTIIPAVILIQIAIPSLLLLYILDESIDSNLTIKAIGHQWYWRYEYRDFWAIGNNSQVEFDAYIIPTNELTRDIFRLLDVDTRIVVPFNIHVRILISSADVLHAWTVPSLGVKADAVPGRLNQVKFIAQRAGVFFGQCSENTPARWAINFTCFTCLNCTFVGGESWCSSRSFKSGEVYCSASRSVFWPVFRNLRGES